MPLAPGSCLGSYRIVAALGSGGMGEVYRAHDARLGRDVALKVLPADMAAEPSRLERFAREARAIAALNHPHIVTIYSTGEADGIRFLTMELVEGTPLDALIPASGMPLPRFLELAVPLADALHAAHQKQITHRDLKPANVMVARDGRVKVLDFGLASAPATNMARGVDPAELVTSPQVTTPGTIIGTMPYMSPEQVEGKPLDHRTDLFSLGVMFHEMLTGTRPFSGDSSPQLISSILRDTPSSTSDLRADVPDALSRLVARCLEKQPDDRVQTARDVYNELRHIQRQLESGARPKPAAVPAGGPPSGATAAGSTWIAVLAFTSAAADEDARALSDGLTEDITAGLARFRYLSVVAEHSARQHKAATADVRQIGKALGARYILDGGIRRGGASVRIAARLVDTESGAQLWSETYTREMPPGNLLSVQDDVTDRVVATVADVHGVLMQSASLGVRGIPIEQLTPEQLRLRYWSYHRQHAPIEHGLLRDHFERLVEAQPAIAPFWAVLAHLYLHEYGFGFNPRPEPLLRARQAADRALELEPLNQHAWEARAFTLFFEQDREAFPYAVDRVLALNPRNANAMALMGILFVHAGDAERGCALADRAMAINPDHPGWYHIARANGDYVSGQFESALRSAKRINMPQHVWAHAMVAVSSAQVGRAADAIAALETTLALEPAFADEVVYAAAAGRWKWLPEHSERMLDGYRKAMAMRREAGRARPPSDAPTSPAATGVAPPGSGAAVSGWPAHIPSGTTPPSDARPAALDMSVAVRPFAVRAGDDEAEDLAEGLIANITTGLSRFPYLRVQAASVARDVSAASGFTTGARFVVDGSVKRRGRAVRVNVRLLEVASDTTLWAEQYDHDGSGDAFTIQDEIGDRVVATLADDGGVLSRQFAAAVRATTGEEHSALRTFVRFAQFVEHFTAEEHGRLRDQYEALVEREASNATAWAHLAILYGLEVFFGFNPLPDPVARVRRAAERSVALDSTHQGAWYALADAAFFERNAAAFRAAADRTIELNPLRSRTAGAIGLLRAFAGDTAEGAALVTRAVSLNPRHPGWFHLALFLDAFQRGDADRALGEAARVNMPHVPVDGKLFAIAAAGRFGRARDAAAAIAELRRDYPHLLDARQAREQWAIRIWSGELLDSLVDGFEAALNAPSAAPPGATGTDSSPARASQAGEIPRTPSPASIAVLPFADLSAEKNQNWFCDGIAEEILNALSHLPGLRVAGRTSSFSFRDRADAAKAIAETLGVNSVLEGSVRRAGDRVRVTVQLVDPANGFQLWSERYDRELKDIFAIQDEIARSVAARLKIVLDSGMERRLVAAHTSSIEAYELYLKGRLLLARRGGGILPALDHFRRSVELDPDYAPAWAGIAEAYVVCGYFGLLPGSEVRRQGPAAARRALLLDPNSADAFASQAVLQQMCENDLAGAGAAFRKALELNPGCVQARCWYALFFLQSALGKYEEGVAEARHAKELDPLSAYTAAILSAALVNAGRAAEAVEEARRATAIDPESFLARWILGRALFHDNQLDEAQSVLEQAAAISNRHQFTIVTLAETHAKRGEVDRARLLHEELVQRSGTRAVPSAELMLTAEATGDREEALAYARQALENRDPSFILLVRHWVDYTGLRHDPRFVSLIRTLDAPKGGALDQGV